MRVPAAFATVLLLSTSCCSASDSTRGIIQPLPFEAATTGVADCPCGDPRLCQPLTENAKKKALPNRTVIGLCHWCSQPDWHALTILTSGGKDATYEPSDELLCAAHAHGVPFLINHALIPPGPEYNGTAGIWYALSQNATRRSDYAAHAAKFMTHHANGTLRRVALDGISFDYENYGTGGINCRDSVTNAQCKCPCGDFGGDAHHWYIPLMAETARTIRAMSPGSMINWDVATNATQYYYDDVLCINAPAGCTKGYSRWNLTGLEEIDTVYAMSYGFDALPKPWSIDRTPNIAHGLTPLQGLEWTVLGEDAIGSIIPRDKLVLGIAWYQMRFMCDGLGPFPGPCPVVGWDKNASGWFPQKIVHSNFGITIYSQIAQLVENRSGTSRAARFDPITGQWYLDVVCPDDSVGTTGAGQPVPWAAVCAGWVGPRGAAQIFFDDPVSLPPKYNLAVKLGIRGIGPYDLEDIAPGCNYVAGHCLPRNASWNQDMWKALRDFAQDKATVSRRTT